MTQTIIITLAALYYLVATSIINTKSAFDGLVFKFIPSILGFLLLSIAVARFMNWPI